MVKFLLIFSKCSLALILSAWIEFVRISVFTDSEDIDMLTAVESLLESSSELSTFKSADFLSGDGDLKAKLCDGDCCKLLVGKCVEVCGAADETGIAEGGKCEGGGMFWGGEILKFPL